MVHIPDQIVDEKTQSLQTKLYLISIVLFIGGVIALANAAGGGIFAILLGWAVGWAGSKIKTTYQHKGGASIYK